MKRDTYRWFIWGIMSLGFFLIFFQRYAIGVIADDLSGAKGLTGTYLSTLGSMYFYAYALMQIPVGLLADTFGPRRIASLGMLLTTIGSFLFAFSSNPFVWILARGLIGIGSAPILISILKFQSIWFKEEEFSTITGITSVVGNIGGLMATTPFALLVMAVGWRSSFHILGLFSLFLALLLWLIVRDYPQDKGYVGIVKENKGGINLTALKGVFFNPYTWVNFSIFFGGLGVIMSFSGLWGVPFLMHTLNLSRDVAAGRVLFFTTGVICGSPLWGFLAKGVKKINVLLRIGLGISLLLWSVFLYLMNGSPPLWILTPFFFFMGFFGISVLLCFTAVKEVNLPYYAGISTSAINVAPFFGTSLLNLLVGLRLDASFTGETLQGARIYSMSGYQQGFMIYLMALLVSFSMTFFLHIDKDKGVKKVP